MASYWGEKTKTTDKHINLGLILQRSTLIIDGGRKLSTPAGDYVALHAHHFLLGKSVK